MAWMHRPMRWQPLKRGGIQDLRQGPATQRWVLETETSRPQATVVFWCMLHMDGSPGRETIHYDWGIK